MELYAPEELDILLNMSDLQKSAIENQRMQSLFKKNAMEVKKETTIADNAVKNDMKKDVIKAMTDETKSSGSVNSSANEEYPFVKAPGQKKGSSISELILPLIGAAAGLAVGGPSGMLMGLGSGAFRTMEMKGDLEKRTLDRDKLALDEQMARESNLIQREQNAIGSERNVIDRLSSRPEAEKLYEKYQADALLKGKIPVSFGEFLGAGNSSSGLSNYLENVMNKKQQSSQGASGPDDDLDYIMNALGRSKIKNNSTNNNDIIIEYIDEE